MARSKQQIVAKKNIKKAAAAAQAKKLFPGQINTSSVSSKVFLDDSVDEFKNSAAVEAIYDGLAAAKARGGKLIERSYIRS